MRDDRTVVLRREAHVLWIYSGNVADELYYNVTGVARLTSGDPYCSSLLQNGKVIGLAWDITEIKEEW